MLPPTGVRQLIVVLLIGTYALLCGACAPSRPSSTPAIGDACLVGNWRLDHEVNRSGWSYSNIPVSVSGLSGAKLALGADGTEREVFAGSAPLVGMMGNGRVLSITVGGSYTFHMHADGRQYVETGTVTALPVTATLGGSPVLDYHGSYSPGTGTYECSQLTLSTTTRSGVQTDTWSRA